jgi:hypothetical protein
MEGPPLSRGELAGSLLNIRYPVLIIQLSPDQHQPEAVYGRQANFTKQTKEESIDVIQYEIVSLPRIAY